MQPKSTFSPLVPCLKIQWLHHSNAALLLATNKSVSTDRWEVFGLTDIKGRRTDVTHWWILCFTLCTVFKKSVHVDQLIYLLVYWSLKVFFNCSLFFYCQTVARLFFKDSYSLCNKTRSYDWAAVTVLSMMWDFGY